MPKPCPGGLCRARWLLPRLLVLGLVLLASPVVGRADDRRGAWSALAPWPIVPIHATLLPDGRLLTFGTTRGGAPTGRFVYDVWDPAEGLGRGHLTLPNGTATDIFCSAASVLPLTGEVLIAGGDLYRNGQISQLGNPDTTLFRPATNRLTSGPRMSRPRWYATTTTLMDGAVYIQGGRGADPLALDANSDHPERRDPDGSIRLLDRADTSALYWYYPRNWLAPDGRVFGYSDRSMYFVDPRGRGMVSGSGTLPAGGPARYTSSEVMFRPGRILRAGGGDDYGAGTARAYVIDINGPVPTVTPTAPMPQGLHWHDAVVLADGRVAVIGGSRMGNRLAGVNATPFIWDPATGRWTTGAATRSGRARLYHSTALLLPDASVLVGGGGAVGPQTNLDAEIWWPPYLFDGDGNRARRPRILEAPRAAEVGERLALRVDDPARIARVTLLRTGSVTHSFDMDQRFLELRFTRTGGTLQVALPRSPGVLPPGSYMLFVLDAAGVPSAASLLQIRVPAVPAARVSWTPSYGADPPGRAATAACPAGQVVVGAEGSADTRLRRLAPLCVTVDEAGRWAGTPAPGTAVGPGGGEPFRRLCPEGSAVVGFRGRAGDELERLALQCRVLAGPERAQGESTWLAPVGGRGGIGRPAYSCTTGRAGTAFYTRTDRSITALGLDCRRRSGG